MDKLEALIDRIFAEPGLDSADLAFLRREDGDPLGTLDISSLPTLQERLLAERFFLDLYEERLDAHFAEELLVAIEAGSGWRADTVAAELIDILTRFGYRACAFEDRETGTVLLNFCRQAA
jgi:hypothetical protein